MAKGVNLRNLLVSVNTLGLDTTLRSLAHIRNGQRDALMGGVNDTLKNGRTYASKLIRDKVNIKKKDLDPHITVDWATKARQAGTLFIRESERIPLKYFGAKELKRGGVSYRIEKKGPKKTLKSAFIIERFGGHVFTRKGLQRHPLQKHHGISAWGAFVVNDYIRPTQKYVTERLQYNIERRVNMLLLRAAGKL